MTLIPHCGDKDTGAWGEGWRCALGPLRAAVQPDSPDSTSCALPGLFLNGQPTHRAKPEAGLQDHRSGGSGAQGYTVLEISSQCSRPVAPVPAVLGEWTLALDLPLRTGDSVVSRSLLTSLFFSLPGKIAESALGEVTRPLQVPCPSSVKGK